MKHKDLIKETTRKYKDHLDRINGMTDRQMLTDRINGMTFKEIGQKYGMTKEQVYHFIKKLTNYIDRIVVTEKIIANDVKMDTKIEDVIEDTRLYLTLKRLGMDTIGDLIEKRYQIDRRKKALLKQIDDIIKGLNLVYE